MRTMATVHQAGLWDAGPQSVQHMTSRFHFADGDNWAEVRDNYNFDAPNMRAMQDDIKRNGIREPIPVDYSQNPPKVVDGHTRLALAERAGLQTVPTVDVDEFDYNVFGHKELHPTVRR